MHSSLKEGLCSITTTTGQRCWAAALIECSVQWLSAGVTVNGAYSFDGCFRNDAAGNLFMHGRSNGLMLLQTAFLQEVGLLVQNGHDGSAYLSQDAVGCEYLTGLGFGPEVRHPLTHRTTVYTTATNTERFCSLAAPNTTSGRVSAVIATSIFLTSRPARCSAAFKHTTQSCKAGRSLNLSSFMSLPNGICVLWRLIICPL